MAQLCVVTLLKDIEEPVLSTTHRRDSLPLTKMASILKFQRSTLQISTKQDQRPPLVTKHGPADR